MIVNKKHNLCCYNDSIGQPPSGIFQWEYDAKENSIRHDDIEKSYYYVEWLAYLIKYALGPRGYVLNGYASVLNKAFNDYDREYPEDLHGYIKVIDNEIDASHPTWEGQY